MTNAWNNTTNYVHPQDSNLRDVHRALQYNSAGEPVLRTHVDGISLDGDVIVDKVRVEVDTLHNTISAAHPLPISGNNNVNSTSNPIYISGNVVIDNDSSEALLVNIGTMPEVEIKNDLNNPIPISATTALNSALNPIHTTFTNTTIGVTGSFWQATQPVSIATMPTTPVTGTFWQTTQPVSGTVTIQDGGNTITVDGTVTANVTFPTTQQVSGTVALDTNTLTALENVGVTGTVGLNAGTNTIGKVDQASTSNPWVISKNSTVNSSSNPLDVTFTNTSIGTTFTNTSIGVTQGTTPWQISKDGSANSTSNRIFVDVGTPTVTVNQPVAVTDNNTTLSIDDGGGSITVDGTVNAVFTGTVTTTVVDGQQDAFGRLRVSEAFTLGDYKHTYGIDPNFRDTLTNGGTVTHIANQACARLATTSNTSSRAIHQTKMYHNYMPGKSQLIKTTINFYAHTANVTKRTGYFDDLNGIYFEQDGAGVLSFVIRTNTSGTASDARRITQANWNTDKCNGTGVSGFNFDITKTQIVFIDFQWLGVGRVRCGFVHDGQMIIAHEFYNSNNLPVVYMANPNLPIRCEILNTGTTTGGYFDQICSTVVSEGGYVESGIDFSVDTGQTSQSITVANEMYPIVAIRLKNSFRGYPNRVVVRSGNINVYAEEYPAYWALYKLDALADITLSSPTWTSADDDSAIEYSLNATAFTGGDRIDGGIVGTTSPGGSAKGTGTAPVNQPSNAKKNFIAQNLDSTDSEIYVVCGKAIGGTTKLWVDFQWREIY
jgi:hypothetical protein